MSFGPTRFSHITVRSFSWYLENSRHALRWYVLSLLLVTGTLHPQNCWYGWLLHLSSQPMIWTLQILQGSYKPLFGACLTRHAFDPNRGWMFRRVVQRRGYLDSCVTGLDIGWRLTYRSCHGGNSAHRYYRDGASLHCGYANVPSMLFCICKGKHNREIHVFVDEIHIERSVYISTVEWNWLPLQRNWGLDV